MHSETEKPLLAVGGEILIERVISALSGSRKFSRIFAGVSPNAPKTKNFLESRGLVDGIIETPGAGYSRDLPFLLLKLRPEKVLVVPADLPLLSSIAVSHVVNQLSPRAGIRSPISSIIIRKDFVEGLGMRPSVDVKIDGERYCHSGISIFDTTRVRASDLDEGSHTMEEHYLAVNSVELAVNVNTKQELDLAEKLLVQRA
jgi:adenosylcobinamide-phosphate guanylyltransferase